MRGAEGTFASGERISICFVYVCSDRLDRAANWPGKWGSGWYKETNTTKKEKQKNNKTTKHSRRRPLSCDLLAACFGRMELDTQR